MSGRIYTSVNYGTEWVDTDTADPKLVDVRYENKLGVPDGYWVMDAASRGDFDSGASGVIVGPSPEEEIVVDHWTNGRQLLLIGREPFGRLRYEYVYGEILPGRRLEVARQIHKGELGQLPPVPKLTAVNRQQTRRQSRYRNKDQWVRVGELFILTGLTPRQIMTNYWPVMDYSWGERHLVPQLEMIRTDGGPPLDEHPILTYEPEDVRQLLDSDRQLVGRRVDWLQVWIRKGIAQTILRLRQWDYDFESVPLPV